MDIAKQVGINLKNARRYNKLTQKEVASSMHITQQQYSRFENGIFQLNYQQIVFLCNLFNISFDELFENTKQFLK